MGQVISEFLRGDVERAGGNAMRSTVQVFVFFRNLYSPNRDVSSEIELSRKVGNVVRHAGRRNLEIQRFLEEVVVAPYIRQLLPVRADQILDGDDEAQLAARGKKK